MGVDGTLKKMQLDSVEKVYERMSAEYLALICNFTSTDGRNVTRINPILARDTARRSLVV